jgi:homocysteine S-methyltransferase
MTTTKTFPPWREGQLFLTDGGIETEITYKWGFELPHFAMYPLLDDADAMAAVRGMYRRHLDVIARHRLSALMGALARRYPRMDVWGGCCGTGNVHLDEIARNLVVARRGRSRTSGGGTTTRRTRCGSTRRAFARST